jgi:phosphoglycolate phosphatase-like HAD superfamily hydrolase
VRLFLFDVDGTLLTARGAGRVAIGRALERTWGTTGPIDAYDFRGKTDPRIVLDLMRAAGVPDGLIAARLPDALEAYVAELRALIGDGHPVRVFPGVAEVVGALAGRPEALVGLLTGNIEAGARVKLAPTGLLPLFRLGAYGSDDTDRNRLPAIACARARALFGHDIPFDQVTIIGDTPLAVACARACGAVAVAVATGFHPIEDLSACGPDLLFRDFSDVRATVDALLAGGAA